MIEKKTVCQIVEEWLEGKDYFLVEVTVSPDDKIVVEIDHAEGVWIEDCVELSRFIESKLNREEEDYELEVGSAGIGQPFKVLQQYYIHIGQEVEVLTGDGRKLAGILKDADEEKFTVGVQKKVKPEGSKRPKLVEEDETFTYEQIKYLPRRRADRRGGIGILKADAFLRQPVDVGGMNILSPVAGQIPISQIVRVNNDYIRFRFHVYLLCRLRRHFNHRRMAKPFFGANRRFTPSSFAAAGGIFHSSFR